MALMSETPSPPNGVVDIINSQSGDANNEDLEDGEIFDDDDDVDIARSGQAQLDAAQNDDSSLQKQHQPPPSGKRRDSPHIDRPKARPASLRRRNKRIRDEERVIQRKRRRSDEDKVSRTTDKELDKDEMMMMMLMEEQQRESDSSGQRQNQDWDRFRSEDEEENDSFSGEGRSGGARGGRRRDFGRSRRGRARGGNTRRGQTSRRDVPSLCKFFMSGKCQRGSECPFSHDMPLPNNGHRKFEMCKFYMNDCCNKREKCQFMHSDFPCKYYHLGLKCYAGRRCKFSHSKVTSYVKQMLIKHNQVESDKHFLQHLPTTSPSRDSRSPSPHLEFNDYDFHQHHQPNNNDHHQYSGGGRRRRHNDFQGGPDDFGQGGGSGRSRNRNSRHQEDRPFDEYKQFNEDPVHGRDSGEDEGPSTPMPSPSHENCSDREQDEDERIYHEREHIHHNSSPSHSRNDPRRDYRDHPKGIEGESSPDHKDNGLEIVDTPPTMNLPRKQRELYMRIQQQQKSADTQQDENEEARKDDDYKEEDWYSSDEEANSGPLATILSQLKSQPKESANPSIPSSLPDFDVSAVSKLLSTVRESIEQIKGSQECQSLEVSQPKPEEKRRRDPRLMRAAISPPKAQPSPLMTSSSDIDLRLTRPAGDVDLRQLPFKPAPPHLAANEINASLASNTQAHLYSLRPFSPPPKPDYTYLHFKNPNDPRLKKYIGSAAVTAPNNSGGTTMRSGPGLLGGMPGVASVSTGHGNMAPILSSAVPMNHFPVHVAASGPQPFGQGLLPHPVGGPGPNLVGLGVPTPAAMSGTSAPSTNTRDPRQRALANDPRRKSQAASVNVAPGPVPLMNPNPANANYMYPVGPQHLRMGGADSDLRNGPPFHHIGDVDLRFHQPAPPQHFPFK